MNSLTRDEAKELGLTDEELDELGYPSSMSSTGGSRGELLPRDKKPESITEQAMAWLSAKWNEPAHGEAVPGEMAGVRWLSEQGQKAIKDPGEAMTAALQGAGQGLPGWLAEADMPGDRPAVDRFGQTHDVSKMFQQRKLNANIFKEAEANQPLMSMAGGVAAPLPFSKAKGVMGGVKRIIQGAGVGALNAGTREQDVGTGALIGGAFGAAGEAPRAFRAGRDWLRGVAESRAAKSMGPMLRDARSMAMDDPMADIGQEMRATGRQMLDEGYMKSGPLGLLPASRATIADKASQSARKSFSEIDSLTNQLDEAGSKRVVQQAEEEARALAAPPPSSAPPLEAMEERYIKDLASRPVSSYEFRRTPGTFDPMLPDKIRVARANKDVVPEGIEWVVDRPGEGWNWYKTLDEALRAAKGHGAQFEMPEQMAQQALAKARQPQIEAARPGPFEPGRVGERIDQEIVKPRAQYPDFAAPLAGPRKEAAFYANWATGAGDELGAARTTKGISRRVDELNEALRAHEETPPSETGWLSRAAVDAQEESLLRDVDALPVGSEAKERLKEGLYTRFGPGGEGRMKDALAGLRLELGATPKVSLPKTFAAAQARKRALDEGINWDVEQTPGKELMKQSRGILANELYGPGGQGEALAPDVTAKLRDANTRYGRAATVRDVASDRVSRDYANRLVSPSDYGTGATVGLGATMLGAAKNPTTGAVAGIAGLVAGALGNHLMRQYGNQVGARMTERVAKVLGSMTLTPRAQRLLETAAARGPSATMAALYALGLTGTQERGEVE